MSSKKTKTELLNHKIQSINNISSYIDSLINSNPKDQSCADKLCYWIDDYTNFLNKEKTFDSKKIISYRKGDIVKVHLGYRIGNEEGGLHYAVVMDKRNNKSNSLVTVIPLTSIKPGKSVHPNSVKIGGDLFQLLISKHNKLHNSILEKKIQLKDTINDIKSGDIKSSEDALNDMYSRLHILDSESNKLDILKKSILNMKKGSIALTNQITTISKIRIYDPLYSHHVLYGIRLQPTTLAKLDNKIKELYF